VEIILLFVVPVISAIFCFLYGRIQNKKRQYDHSCQEYQQQINTLHAQFLALGVSTDEAAENLRRLGEALREKEAQSLIMDKEMEVQSAQLDSLTEKSELLSRSIEEKEQILVDQERIVRERLKTETEQYAATLEAEQQTVVNEFLADWNAMIQETAAKKAVIEQELEQAQKNAWAAVDQAKIALATQ
jgi:chromosome segregation ATPase